MIEPEEIAKRLHDELKEEGVEVTGYSVSPLKDQEFCTHAVVVTYWARGKERSCAMGVNPWNEWLTPIAKDFKKAVRRDIKETI